MLKNILFGRRTKKRKKGVFFREWGFFVKRGRLRGVKEGRGVPGKGVSLEKESGRFPTLQVIFAGNGAPLHLG